MQKEGFTLIELLVVVLIIGILAAVAVPQYQVAVAKSRLTQALVMLKSIKDAQQVFFVTNSYYAPTLEELNIDLPGCTLDTEESTQSGTITDNFYSCPNDIQFLIHVNTANPQDLNTTYAFLFALEKDTKKLAVEYHLNKLIRYCQSNFSAGQKACQSFGGTQFTTKGDGSIIVYKLP